QEGRREHQDRDACKGCNAHARVQLAEARDSIGQELIARHDRSRDRKTERDRDQIKQRFDSHCGPHAVPRPKSWQSPVPPAICFLIKGKRRDPARDYGACDTHPRFELRNKSMAHTWPGRWRRAHNPLLIPSLLLVGTLCLAAGYVGYVLWP